MSKTWGLAQEGPTAGAHLVDDAQLLVFRDERYEFRCQFGPRKRQWSYVGEMEEQGWEYVGWERFDDHEEEYYRRLKIVDSTLTSALPSRYDRTMITPPRLFNVQAVVIKHIGVPPEGTRWEADSVEAVQFAEEPTMVSAYLISTDMKSAMDDFEIEFGEVVEWQVVTGSEQAAVIGRSILNKL